MVHAVTFQFYNGLELEELTTYDTYLNTACRVTLHVVLSKALQRLALSCNKFSGPTNQPTLAMTQRGEHVVHPRPFSAFLATGCSRAVSKSD